MKRRLNKRFKGFKRISKDKVDFTGLEDIVRNLPSHENPRTMTIFENKNSFSYFPTIGPLMNYLDKHKDFELKCIHETYRKKNFEEHYVDIRFGSRKEPELIATLEYSIKI